MIARNTKRIGFGMVRVTMILIVTLLAIVMMITMTVLIVMNIGNPSTIWP